MDYLYELLYEIEERIIYWSKKDDLCSLTCLSELDSLRNYIITCIAPGEF